MAANIETDGAQSSSPPAATALLILAERGCVEDQPQRVDKRNRLGFHGLAAAGRDYTAARGYRICSARCNNFCALAWFGSSFNVSENSRVASLNRRCCPNQTP